MKKIIKCVVALGSLASLCSCTTKTDYATFNQKAKDALQTKSPYVRATVTIDAKEGEVTLNGSQQFVRDDENGWGVLELNDVAITEIAYGIINMTLRIVVTDESNGDEDEWGVWYAGNTFKAEIPEENLTYEWNKYGDITSYKEINNDYSIKATVKYSK